MNEAIINFADSALNLYSLVGKATLETLVMVLFSGIFSVLIGFPLGVLLYTTGPNGLRPKPVFNQILSRIINALRSFPFLILMILLFPLSRLILGTAIGTKATIIPLSIAAAPFVARLIETSLTEVDLGVIQAARSMGSTNGQIIVKVLIPEALPSIVSGITLTIINLIGYSAMAGTIGGGGLGDLAIRYGYQRFRPMVMFASVVVILILVEVIQWAGTKLSNSILKKRGLVVSAEKKKNPLALLALVLGIVVLFVTVLLDFTGWGFIGGILAVPVLVLSICQIKKSGQQKTYVIVAMISAGLAIVSATSATTLYVKNAPELYGVYEEDVYESSDAVEEDAEVYENGDAVTEDAEVYENGDAVEEGADGYESSGAVEEGVDGYESSDAVEEGADVYESGDAVTE